VTAENDLDRDGLKDECEARFAAAFEPQLVFNLGELHAEREPYWTVRLWGEQVTIGYLLSYYYDGV
jgi:hypothetical protein